MSRVRKVPNSTIPTWVETSGETETGLDGVETSGRDSASLSCAGHTVSSGRFSRSSRAVVSVAGWISSPELQADDGGDWDG